jgi:hypothetical protein
MPFVPLIQSFRIIRAQKYAAKAGNRSHRASEEKRSSGGVYILRIAQGKLVGPAKLDPAGDLSGAMPIQPKAITLKRD